MTSLSQQPKSVLGYRPHTKFGAWLIDKAVETKSVQRLTERYKDNEAVTTTLSLLGSGPVSALAACIEARASPEVIPQLHAQTAAPPTLPPRRRYTSTDQTTPATTKNPISRSHTTSDMENLKDIEARIVKRHIEGGPAVTPEDVALDEAIERFEKIEMKNTEDRIRKSYVQRGQAITADDRLMEKLQNQKIAEQLQYVAGARPGKGQEATLRIAHTIATSNSRSEVDVLVHRVITMIGTQGLMYYVLGGSLGVVLATGILHTTGDHAQVFDAAGQMYDPNAIVIPTDEGFKVLTDAPNDGNCIPDQEIDVVNTGNGLFYDNIQQIGGDDVMSAAAEHSADQAGEFFGGVAEVVVGAGCIVM